MTGYILDSGNSSCLVAGDVLLISQGKLVACWCTVMCVTELLLLVDFS